MKLKLLFAGLAVAAGCVAILVVAANTGTDSGTTAVQSGLRVSADPETGRVINDAAETVSLSPDADLFTSSGEGLEVVPSPVPGGGFMIDLQGRFQSAHVATVDENGTRAVECIEQVPAETLVPGE